MSEHTLQVRAVDTLLFRDGRPFTGDPGARADTQLVLAPSTMAGFLRTTHGRRTGRTDWERLSAEVRVRGPLLTRNGEALLAAPADALVVDDADATRVLRVRPGALDKGAGVFDSHGVRPLVPPEDVKASTRHAFWTWGNVEQWLCDEDPLPLLPDRAPPTDERVHLRMKDGVAEEGHLFSTRMVAHEAYRWEGGQLAEQALFALVCRVAGVEAVALLHGPGTLGGESRLAVVEPAPPRSWPVCSPELGDAISRATRVRVLLATPAIFGLGWMPQWLDRTTKEGAPPGAPGVRLKLVAAAVPRRQPVSGWDYVRNVPKPVRWMAPAGSVYFFELLEGDPGALAADAWLQPVSDDDKDRSDGFGLALWGVWNENGGAE